MTTIHTISIGQPQTFSDASGVWRSSIYRSPVSAPIWLGRRGLAGDQVSDTKNHGSPDQAGCCYDLAHYTYWNQFYRLEGEARLGAGAIGENWTLVDGAEDQLCVGDIYAVGEAQVQISAPRYPCRKQQRKLGLPDFLQNSRQTMRTGFYLRVLREGMVKEGFEWRLIDRPQPAVSLALVNRSMLTHDPELANHLLTIPELAEGWKAMLIKKYG